MGFLFDSGEEETTQTSDNWSGLPDWMKKSYRKDDSLRRRILNQGEDLAAELGADPRAVLGLDPLEVRGMQQGIGGLNAANDLGRSAAGATDDLSSLFSQYLDPAGGALSNAKRFTQRARGQVGGAQDSVDTTQNIVNNAGGLITTGTGYATDDTLSDQAAGAASDRTASLQALEAAGFDIDALRDKYQSGYTNDVVDTTLAGMTRAADRERLRRESQNAGIGGTSNTRMAVADAMAQELTGEAMGRTEAQLRDDAFTRAMEGAFGEAGLELERAGTLDQLGRTELDRAGVFDKLAQTGLDRGSLLDQLARTRLGQADSQRGITADTLDIGEFLRGLGGDERDRAAALANLASTGADIGSTQANLYNTLANSRAARAVTKAGMWGGIGETRRGLAQDQLDENRTSQQQSLGWLADLFAGTQAPKGPGVTETTAVTPTPSPFQSALGLAATAAGAFLQSDERVKEEIEPLASGLDAIRELYPSSYSYKPGFGHVEGRTAGLMAQDVERAGIPGAVREFGGVKHVDPYPILATVVQAVRELDARTAA